MKKINQHKITQRRNDIHTTGWTDYELLDSGNNKKLERFGSHKLTRFEKEAVWKPTLSLIDWKRADAEFTILKGANQGLWEFLIKKPQNWSIKVDEFEVLLNISNSRHIGIFPEQVENWRWIERIISKYGHNANILNLFGYTGVATLYAARAGAIVTHVDASRKANELGKNSLQTSNLGEKPVRWLVDDVRKFILREIRRGNKYDGIILDPPKFGRGPKGEVWKFDSAVLDLLNLCGDLLSENPIMFILTAYDIDYTPENISGWVCKLMKRFSGTTEFGNLVQQEKSSGRKITQAIYARWSPPK
jgi:23S rRNA (cytosine1962-C5)-methyltransferase